MSQQDLTVTCNDCRRPFTFAEKEQGLFRELGFEAPKRCHFCLQSRDARRRYPLGLLPLTAFAPTSYQRN